MNRPFHAILLLYRDSPFQVQVRKEFREVAQVVSKEVSESKKSGEVVPIVFFEMMYENIDDECNREFGLNLGAGIVYFPPELGSNKFKEPSGVKSSKPQRKIWRISSEDFINAKKIVEWINSRCSTNFRISEPIGSTLTSFAILLVVAAIGYFLYIKFFNIITSVYSILLIFMCTYFFSTTTSIWILLHEPAWTGPGKSTHPSTLPALHRSKRHEYASEGLFYGGLVTLFSLLVLLAYQSTKLSNPFLRRSLPFLFILSSIGVYWILEDALRGKINYTVGYFPDEEAFRGSVRREQGHKM